MTKPTIIIGCSDKKNDLSQIAFDLYLGGMFTLFKVNVENPLESFNILILSAKHGLIKATDVISPYDTKMVSKNDAAAISEFAKKHSKVASKLLNDCSKSHGNLFVILSNDYLSAFDALADQPNFNKILKQFSSVYVSRKHRGIGDLRGRLKRILTMSKRTVSPPTLFRSGLASDDELVGFSKAGSDLGASLAYISDIKSPHRLHYLKQALLRGSKVFLDNGMITEIGRGNFVSPSDVFERYIKIVKALKPKIGNKLKNLSIVVPDDPFSCSDSIGVVKNFKQEIKWLNKRVTVILPIHKSSNIAEHAKQMMQSLDNIRGICVGVPCKESIKTAQGSHSLRMPLCDIETIFSLKAKNGNPMFTNVHFLALSEVSRNNIFQERKLICDIYNIEMSCDACRTTAIMGNNKLSKRAGSVALRKITKTKTKLNTVKSQRFVAHDIEDEYEYPYVHERIMTMIDENLSLFLAFWNTVMGQFWALSIESMQTEDAKAYCKDVICAFPRYLENDIVESFKPIFWDEFEEEHHRPSAFDVRAETFTQVFIKDTRQEVQLEMAV